MTVLKALNLVVRFLLELCMLAAVGYWGFKTGAGWGMKIVLGIGLPVLIAVIWGLFVAPKAVYPLSRASRVALELVLFGLGAVALFASGRADLGWIYTVVLVVSEILMIVWKQ
jgi:hypothetical protein